ncbi:uncharacterized protein [Lolium perenne]|uniref:uncharacterized protein n=1 Tax=Lolium perenne TaxID=4522 RepID=UPI0021F5B6EF|nr:nucleosome assembly protein 1;3-like [Lolium perenne]
MVGMARANRGFFSGMPKPIDSRFLRFVNHIGLEEVSKIFSDSVDLDETRKAFAKMVSDFNSKPLVVDGYDEEHQDLEDEDMDESDSEEEEEDEADGKACELFGDTKRARLQKTVRAPIEDEQEPKKPRIAEGPCVQGNKTEAAGIKDSSQQDEETNREQQINSYCITTGSISLQ